MSVGISNLVSAAGTPTATLFGRTAAYAWPSPRRAAAEAIKRVNVDGFFRDEARSLDDRTQWTDVLDFNANGNSLAAIEFIPTAGESPEGVFGPTDYGNTFMLSVWALSDGTVLLEFSARNNRRVLEPRRFSPDGFSADCLALAYRDFRCAAERLATAVVV